MNKTYYHRTMYFQAPSPLHTCTLELRSFTAQQTLLCYQTLNLKATIQSLHGDLDYCCVRTPFEEAIWPLRRGSTSQAILSARANALKVASTMW